MAESPTSMEALHGVDGEAAAIQANYDDHVCEFCGQELPDPGPSFLKHLDEADTCKWLWFAYRPRVQQEAGGS